jgi:hypothetical protein
MPRRSRPGQGSCCKSDSVGSGGDTVKPVVVWGSHPPRDQCHNLSLTRGRLQGLAANLGISPLLASALPARRQRPGVALWRRRGLCSDGSHWRGQGQRERELVGTKASGPNQTRACKETGWRTWGSLREEKRWSLYRGCGQNQGQQVQGHESSRPSCGDSPTGSRQATAERPTGEVHQILERGGAPRS